VVITKTGRKTINNTQHYIRI